MENHKIRNAIVAVVIAVGMVFSFYYLENAFRGGDTRRAIQAVQQNRKSPESPTVLEGLKKNWGNDSRIEWHATLTDRIRGFVRVTCVLPNGDKRFWKVDVLNGAISEIDSAS